jgi:hypothetical protein
MWVYEDEVEEAEARLKLRGWRVAGKAPDGADTPDASLLELQTTCNYLCTAYNSGPLSTKMPVYY